MSPQVRERIPVVIAEYDEVSRVIARRIADVIAERRKAGDHAVLGLATGSTPIGIYRELARLHREEGVDFSDVVTFNLDEYFPMRPESIHSYNRYMWENLFDEINV
jgi:glucosamine-6-phosphate deaminase